MPKKKLKVAICYDFDGTLAPGNMQEHSLLPELGIKSKVFWDEVKDAAKTKKLNEILAYMHLTLDKARAAHHKITRQAFRNHGKNIKLFDGLGEYFNLINEYAKSKNIELEHYVISSGLKEIIEGTVLKRKFKFIFASEFLYDENGVAIWPALAIDYTNKTQYLFRINKGILNVWDNTKINKFTPEEKRRIPFSRMIYIGDGETDIPAMKMVNLQGGYSIAVYDTNKRHSERKSSPKEICFELVKHKRASFIAPANFTEKSTLFNLLITILNKITVEGDLDKIINQNKGVIARNKNGNGNK